MIKSQVRARWKGKGIARKFRTKGILKENGKAVGVLSSGEAV